MDSFFARNRLSAYLDGALPPAEAREVAAAIERDPELSAEYEALRRTVALLQQDGPAKAPAGFHARVMSKVAEEKPPAGGVVRLRRWFTRLPVEAVALAAAAAVVVVAIQWRPDAPPEELDGPDHAAAVAPEAPVQKKDGPAPEPAAEGGKNMEAAKEEPAVAEVNDGNRAELQAGTTQASAPARKGRSTNGAPAAKQAYVPEWEAAEKPEVASVTGMSLTVSNPQVVHQLEQLARRAGGSLHDSKGRAMRAVDLTTEAPSVAVMLVVPAHQATSIRSQLSGFGAKSATAPSGLMVGSGNAGFYVAVQLVEGAQTKD